MFCVASCCQLWIILAAYSLRSPGGLARTIVIVAELDKLLLDSGLQLVEALDRLSLWRVRLAPGVDGVYSGLSSP